MSVTAASRGVPIVLQDAQTTGNGLVIAIPATFNRHRIYVKGHSTISAGAVQPETASDPAYTGTWAPLGAAPITVGDGTEVVYEFEGPILFLRGRISTDITGSGGSVTVTYIGQ